eukprot:TRINITY_DN5816_c0_g1_i1.p1 TRINITY_DN5816_c0_g1~~TRINITY_DN5816_c0_g1_i1.p1  ORF type:complete len:247 (+),score=41.72 TRINITY_DN5816_c0_g1_i1:55-795(+)
MSNHDDDARSDAGSQASHASSTSSYTHNPYDSYCNKEYQFSPSVSPTPSVGDLGSLGSLPLAVNPNLDYSEYYSDRLQEVEVTWMVLVQFKFGRTGWYEHTEELEQGTHVIVQADRGSDMAMVCRSEVKSEKHESMTNIRKVSRIATKPEIAKWQDVLAEREKKAIATMQEMTDKKKLNITIVHSEYQYDGKKLTFYFTSKDAHPQFRVILDQAFSMWKCRIWFARYSRLSIDSDCRERLSALTLA